QMPQTPRYPTLGGEGLLPLASQAAKPDARPEKILFKTVNGVRPSDRRPTAIPSHIVNSSLRGRKRSDSDASLEVFWTDLTGFKDSRASAVQSPRSRQGFDITVSQGATRRARSQFALQYRCGRWFDRGTLRSNCAARDRLQCRGP